MPLTDATMATYVEQVAVALGAPWRLDETTDPGNPGLLGPDGMRVTVTLDTWHSGPPKVIFEGRFPDEISGFQPDGTTRTVIRVSASRSAADAAKEMQRRFIGPFTELMASTRAAHQQRVRDDADRVRLLSKVAATFGTTAGGPDSTVHLGSYLDSVSVNARVRRPYPYTALKVEFHVEAAEADALIIAGVLAQHHQTATDAAASR